MLCDEELNYCEKNPNTCQNGGKCTSLMKDDGNFKCECPSGYKGLNCEILPPSMITSSSSTTTMATTSTSQATIDEHEQMTSLRLQLGNVTTQYPGEDYLNEEYSAEDVDNEA